MAPTRRTPNTGNSAESLDENPTDNTIEVAPEPNLTDIARTLHALMEQVTSLSNRVTVMEERTAADPFSSARSTSDSSSEDPDPAPAKRDPKVASPEMFSGNVADFQNFLAQCTLVLTVSPNTYSTDEQRVLFVISHLKGEPLTWARDIVLESKHPLRNDYSAFKLALSNIYGDRAYKANAEDKLQRLAQTGSAAVYAQRFQALAAPLDLNDNAKCIMFYGGLKPEIKRAIITSGRAAPLHALIDQAINYDQLLFQQAREERLATPSKRELPTAATTFATPPMAATPTSSNTVLPRPVGEGSQWRPPLTDAEKEFRRLHNLCAYCGKPGHGADTCGLVQRKNAFQTNAAAVTNLNFPPLLYPVPSRPGTTAPSENGVSQPPRT